MRGELGKKVRVNGEITEAVSLKDKGPRRERSQYDGDNDSEGSHEDQVTPRRQGVRGERRKAKSEMVNRIQ